LVLSEEEAYFAAADSYITGRNISIRSDMSEQFRHKTLAEPHNLIIGFPLWIKIRTTFSSSHGKGCEAVLEYLLECQEFQYSKIHCGMKSKASFVGSNGTIHFDPESPVDLDFP